MAARTAPAPAPAPAAAAAIAPARQGIRRSGFTVAADGSYASCLAFDPSAQESASPATGAGPGTDGQEGAGTRTGTESAGARAVPAAGSPWFVERWTLGGPEAYAVPLPVERPEEAGTPTMPLADGRVLVVRRAGDCHEVALLYPSGTGTGQARAGSLPGPGVRLLPPSPAPGSAFALTWDDDRTVVWRVHGTACGVPEPVATVDGRCAGGVWLDRAGRLLALDRELDGRTKTVAVDLHGGTVAPLLHLTDDSDDRLLLADPDSGLLMLRSDAAGETRLGWGVLGSGRPVRFPDALCVPGTLLTPVAAQPGQFLSPEATVVALRGEVPGGAAALALWRPAGRGVRWLPAPEGWLGPVGVWLPGTPLRLPYAAPAPAAAPSATAGTDPAADLPSSGPATDPDLPRSPGSPGTPATPETPGPEANAAAAPVRAALPATASPYDCGLAAYDVPPAGEGQEPATVLPRRIAGPEHRAAGTSRSAGGVAASGARVVRDSRRALPLRRALAVLPLQQAPLAAPLAAPMAPTLRP